MITQYIITSPVSRRKYGVVLFFLSGKVVRVCRENKWKISLVSKSEEYILYGRAGSFMDFQESNMSNFMITMCVEGFLRVNHFLHKVRRSFWLWGWVCLAFIWDVLTDDETWEGRTGTIQVLKCQDHWHSHQEHQKIPRIKEGAF